MFDKVQLPTWLTPVRTTFFISLMLSLVAWLGTTVNRDGMLYVQTAHAFLEGGFTAARMVFNWPFLPIAMALLSNITGLSPETAGYLLNACFMAGVCALMVSCVAQKQPTLAWTASVVVLAIPGLNEYRNELLREFGCWFFIMLSFWLATKWEARLTWTKALIIQTVLLISALFRPETLALFPALVAWQWFSSPKPQRLRRCMMLGTLPLLGSFVLLALYLDGTFSASNRLASDLARISGERFDAKAELLANGLIVYAHENTRTILFFGSLSLIPEQLFVKFGIFLIPLIFLFARREQGAVLKWHPLFAWAITAHLLVLAIFVLDLQFLAGRYVGPILLFSVPFVTAGMYGLLQAFPNKHIAIIGLALLMALSNVISTSPGKTHLVDAGHWLKANIADPSTVYIDSHRTAYHAEWLKIQTMKRADRIHIEEAIRNGPYTTFVLEVSRNDVDAEQWISSLPLHITRTFPHPNGDRILIGKPLPSEKKEAVENTER